MVSYWGRVFPALLGGQAADWKRGPDPLMEWSAGPFRKMKNTKTNMKQIAEKPWEPTFPSFLGVITYIGGFKL